MRPSASQALVTIDGRILEGAAALLAPVELAENPVAHNHSEAGTHIGKSQLCIEHSWEQILLKYAELSRPRADQQEHGTQVHE